jgi:hypothetical protein
MLFCKCVSLELIVLRGYAREISILVVRSAVQKSLQSLSFTVNISGEHRWH